MTGRAASHEVLRVWPARVAAVTLVILGFIPYAAFLKVGLVIPDLGSQLKDWGTGSLLTLGVGIVAGLAARRGHLSPLQVSRTLPWRPATRIVLVALCSFIGYALIATFVFSRRPLLIDELVQLWQAQRYAEGHLALPAPLHREFFSFMHLVDTGDRVYAQFPPGGPFMLWLGVLAGAPWLVGPACGALCVWLFGQIARAAEPAASDAWVLGATVLFAVTPFAVFMFGSHMNHVTALLWILVAVVALTRLVDSPRPTALGPAFVLGLGLGAAATIRPLDALAFALPAAVWLVARAGRSPKHWIENVVAGVGVALPFAAMMYVNLQTTGHPLLFGYEVLWGAAHGLGFHAAPWGMPHTPLRGFALAALYQWRLQTYLFETPFPSLVLPVLALFLARRVSAIDRYLLTSGALLVFLYFLYWHDGLFLGPRFVVALIPVLVLWTARLPRLLLARLHAAHLRVAVSWALGFAVVGALVFNLPVRVATYRGGFATVREDYARAAEQAGVRDALVFVRESWGAQLIGRLWGLGVSRPLTESAYRHVDTCNLELEISTLERSGVRGSAAQARIAQLIAQDSAFVLGSTLTPDLTERIRPDLQYAPVCLERIAEDRAGFLHYVPLQLVTTGGNIYARDLHERDSLLLAQYPERRVYLLRRAGTRVDDRLEYLPLNRDSLVSAWRASR